MLQLRVFNYQTGEFQAKTLAVDTHVKGEWIIGRNANCDLVLESPEVSRVHGGIRCQEGSYFYTDFGSTNGSSINNNQAKANQSYLLAAGDMIRIEEFVLVIETIETVASSAENAVISERQKGPRKWETGDLSVRCVQVITETHDVKTFRFKADPPALFEHKPGQFITLELDINGERVRRPYSISSPPSRPHLLDITVKRTLPPTDAPDFPPGKVSNWLHDHMIVGGEVKLIGGPMGKFTCADQPAQKLMLISAGSGITPMISMARWLYDTADERDLVFFHSARNPGDIILQQELEFMASRQPNFRLALTVTQPTPNQAWIGLTGRLTAPLLMHIAPDYKERAVYVCGSDGFMQAVKTLFIDLSFPMENYYEESFGSSTWLKAKFPPPVKAGEPPPQNFPQGKFENAALSQADSVTPASSSWNDPGNSSGNSPGNDMGAAFGFKSTSINPNASGLRHAVLFAQSKQEIHCDPEESILDVAEQAGINIRSGCRQGVCGTCKVRKLEGEVRYDVQPDILDQSEQAAGFILTCVAFADGRVVVAA
ncbi:MAG: FHA domain-containing protein [Leptolyngbyaceae cyanobacterium MO_188.B28]|nr:FHA domain-containing protein [Leptolyngbyaceae cyanobacterium MO_188.B28]